MGDPYKSIRIWWEILISNRVGLMASTKKKLRFLDDLIQTDV